ncbi:GIY-YIG nuclease family protein [Streptomyces sp. R28]|uniref:GIY-YIG nuclease family protein n=1 Tax=Streptomyces sp. R28 TaxID=3238628 RepID=A0AB39PWE4_9ACTN
MPEPQPTEVVYVLGTPGSKTVKIGRTIDPEKRLSDIQRMSPVPLGVLWTHPGGHELETNLHRQFSALRTHGEWFTFGGDPVVSVQWAIKDEPWLRQKVSLKKKAPRPARAPETTERGPEDSPEQLGRKMAKMWSGLMTALSALADIQDPVKRYEAMQLLEDELSDEFREIYQLIAADLKKSGRTWRQVGEVMGGVSAQRAHQISLGGTPLYGAKATQNQQAS